MLLFPWPVGIVVLWTSPHRKAAKVSATSGVAAIIVLGLVFEITADPTEEGDRIPTPTDESTTRATPALMPKVVCMSLTDAQDDIQTTGVFFSRSFDATGQDRSQVRDSNWLVVSQDPAPGVPITGGSSNLGAVKYGEQKSC